MDNNRNELYFLNHNKLVFPEVKEETNAYKQSLAVTVAANFAELGFIMDKSAIDKLSMATENDIINFYDNSYPILQRAIGADKKHKPFYPNFPEEVMDKSRIDIFIDQVIYGLSGFELRPDVFENAKAAFPFIGETTLHAFTPSDINDYYNDMQTVMRSATPYSSGQIKELKALFAAEPQKAVQLLPSDTDVKHKENKTILTSLCMDFAKSNTTKTQYLKNPTDILRLVSVRSALRDCQKTEAASDLQITNAYHNASLQYDKTSRPSFNLSKREWRFVLKSLNEILLNNPEKANDFYAHNDLWKRFFSKVHVDELNKQHLSAVVSAAKVVRENIKLNRYEQRIEEAIKSNNFDTALAEAKTRPGDFMRRFDKLLRMSIDASKSEEALSALSSVVPKAGIATTMSLISHIKHRSNTETTRVFNSHTIKNKNREPFPENIINSVSDICINGISEKFRGKGNMGNVYISPLMQNFKTPMETRILNEGVDVNSIGSVTQIKPEKDFLRMFVGWNNQKNGTRVDIDLTATTINAYGEKTHIGWDSNYDASGIVYSGDVQSGQNRHDAKDCAVEYIDINLNQLKENGTQYIIIALSLFCGAKSFSDLDDIHFGYMQRTEKELGDLFEAKTVDTIMNVSNDSTICIPVVYDVLHERVIATNKQIDEKSNVASKVIDKMFNMLPVIKMEVDNKMPLNTIIEANARTNGHLVDNIEDATLAFITPQEKNEYLEKNGDSSLDNVEIHFPYDAAYMSGVLLASPVQGMDLFKNQSVETQATKCEDLDR